MIKLFGDDSVQFLEGKGSLFGRVKILGVRLLRHGQGALVHEEILDEPPFSEMRL
jgi:hypothetical protein